MFSGHLLVILKPVVATAASMGSTNEGTSGHWRFGSEAHPDATRIGAWRDAVSRLGLTSTLSDVEVGLTGTIACHTTPLGVVFAQMASGAQQFVRRPVRGDNGVLIIQHIDGVATFKDGIKTISRHPGDMIVAGEGGSFTLEFTSSFRQTVVRIPRVIANTRLLTLQASRTVHLPGRKGFGLVFSQLLDSIMRAIDSLDETELRSIDIALSELLVASLAEDPARSQEGGPTGMQTAMLHRLCQKLESQLSDPELSIAKIAKEEGLSPRYLQKLFQSSGDSFTGYIRNRRLERCRLDLKNPQLSNMSISDIAFRWGFNDAGHFSRAFKDQFGASPREFRLEGSQQHYEEAEPHHVNRGWPNQAIAHKRQRPTVFPDADPPFNDALNALFDKSAAHHHLKANENTVHWGYFSRALPPVVQISSGDTITIEGVTQHGNDDRERMIEGDEGLERIYHWTPTSKNIDRRGAGPVDASIYGRGSGEGFGVHILTGPVAVKDAKPGDILEVRILDILPRPSANPKYAGCCFGSNAATWWGFHYDDLLTEPKPREVVTIYEFDLGQSKPMARAVLNYRWTPQTDPFGVVHTKMDYPGVPVDPSTVEKNVDVLKGVSIPLRPHFGVIGVAPRESDLVDSVPPSYSGGNIDNWRVGKGSTIYLPVAVPEALLSIGDPHASQGDSEICGTAIECSLTGVFQVILHKRGDLDGKPFADLTYPLIETPEEWVLLGFSHPNYLAELGEKAQSNVYEQSSLDLALKDAFRKMRRFLMTTQKLSEDEAISLMSVAVDFGVTQVVNGNWGVHAVLRKELFDKERRVRE
jgi:acetamidase/formamidase/AraC-like DNA-binding protein